MKRSEFDAKTYAFAYQFDYVFSVKNHLRFFSKKVPIQMLIYSGSLFETHHSIFCNLREKADVRLKKDPRGISTLRDIQRWIYLQCKLPSGRCKKCVSIHLLRIFLQLERGDYMS